VKDWAIRSVTVYVRLVGYDRHSETERVLVNKEGLAIPSLLKIQSGPLGNLWDFMEMNLHMPQDNESESELKNLAAVPYQIISPANNKAIIGIFQDSMLGCFRFTRENIHFTPREAMNLLMMFNRVNAQELLEKGDMITNFDILSQILPPLTMSYKTKLFKEGEDAKKSNHVLEIRNGKYIRGQMDKGVIETYTKGLLQRICNDFGNMASSNFVDDIQNIITEYMKSSSYSVGISDLISDNKTNQRIIQRITEKKNQVKTLIDQIQMGIFQNDTGKSNDQEFETQVNNILNQASAEAGKIGLESLDKNNRFVIMVNAGSKGSELNISQMISCLGQQNVDGKRIPYGFEQRTLPHFSKFDDSPGARGFVESSYINGLSPQELFFHAMGGRVGLIDTAVKSVTWETPIVIIENKSARYTEIGRWIDAQLDEPENKSHVQHFTERQMELLNINEGDVFIPTTDENGVVTWGPVTAITRHDPGTELYEIKTTGGRSVIVTESKSLLIWNAETKKLKEMPTPEIKVGDCVPVTRELCEPPIVIKSLDISSYLPKTEYIYGTDLNKALKIMQDTMENRKKIPDGWWDENNGKQFTLPFTKKASLQRTSVRSNMENIKDGFVYPYSGKRRDFCIPEHFALNESNGIFIGLFLAEGNAHKTSVTITNNNENIQTFVKNWFDKHTISWVERKRINKIGGLTTTITGNSSVLSSFITKWVGHGAENKHVPTESFIATEDFIIGLLNGYFSGDGTISKNSVEVGSASKRLIEGISMLCSRLGIFGKVFQTQLKSNNLGTKNIKPTYRFAIRAQWGQRFAEKISLLEEKKQERLRNIVWGHSHRNFNTYNDVVLDKITEINIIGLEKHPKVYDLTIPTTLNFGIANGLQVRDTSSTGYIQRRLIKGLEDLMVGYDMTIRTNKNKIVQFVYGDDSVDTVKVENQPIPIVTMSTQEIYSHFNLPETASSAKELSLIFEKNTLKRDKKQKDEINKKCKLYTDMMIDNRQDIIKNVFKNKGDNIVSLPVAFSYIIGNIQGQQNINSNSMVDLTMLEAYEMIENTFHNLEKIHYAKPTLLFKILYYYYLSAKDLLINKRFNRSALTILLNTIVADYKRAIVSPGEMVGMTAGQSIGEISTQMTLNSFTFETPIIVRNSDGNIQKVELGKFIEEKIKISTKKEYYENKDTTYAEVDDYYEIPSCDEDGNVLWKRIEAVTRHPVINEDGTNTMIKVTTDEEREVIATKAKSFLKLVNGKLVPFEGKDLKVGDYIPVSTKQIDFTETRELDLRTILPPTEYMYGTEVEKAKAVMGETFWWKKHSGKTFVLPYKRSDSFTAKVSDKLRAGSKSKTILKPGCVYTLQTNMCDYEIPETIPLDYNFGYFVGAYAAEGCMTKFQMSIANNDTEYFKPILELCEQWNIKTKVYRNENKNGEGCVSQDIRIYNTVLCRLMENLCGKLSHNKFVADKIVFSNRECMLGFLDAYIGGDGCVSVKEKTIRMSSVSKTLLTDVQQILNNLGVYSHINLISSKTEKIIRGNLRPVKPIYGLNVCNYQGYILASMMNMKLEYKQDNLLHILQKEEFIYDYNRKYTTIPNEIDGEIVMEPRTDTIMKDVLFNKIKSIEEVPNTTKYAYDLTVVDTRNFNIYNGLACRDTFHFAGVSSKSNVTRGVPRIEEILSLSSEPKNPSLTVHLKPEDETDKDKAHAIMYMLEHTKLEEIVQSVEICFDPDDLNTLINDDKTTIEQYRAFENMIDECANAASMEETNEKSKWIIRMIMDPVTMLEKNITMDDVHFTMKNSYTDELSCIYSDYNADKLVFRIRMNSVLKQSAARASAQKKIKINPLDQSDQIYILKNFQDDLLNNIVLRGIKGINKVSMRKIKDNVVEQGGVFKKQDIWVLDTIGTNMLDVLGLDYIDAKRVFSNNIVEVYDILGIEAARQTIYNELADVIEFDGTYVNYHHFCVLCDRMTFTHKMISIFRHGINNDNIGPIAKASFEETPEMFLKAARHAELDTMRGISANVMCGQEGFFGTSAFQVVLDMDTMKTLEEEKRYEEKVLDEEEDLIEKSFHVENPEDACGSANMAIQNNVVSIKSKDMGKDNTYEPGF
jgi:DNA-directed RNA polymerase beta' subunit